MNEVITDAVMKHFIQNSPLVHIKEEEFHGDKVFVVKYSRKVFYKALWNENLERLRGMVLDANYNLISNPFKKVYNYTEQGAVIPLENRVMAVQKINGFMAAASFYKGKLLVSTSGTISSEFADMARKWIEPHEPYMRDFVEKNNVSPTFIFEICDPSDPHIVYEHPGVYLLGIRAIGWNSAQNAVSQHQLDKVAEMLHVMRPYWRTYKRFQLLLDEVKTCQHEGYMAYDLGPAEQGYHSTSHYYDNAEPTYGTIKLKSPFYLVIKFLGRMAEKNSDLLFSDPEKFKEKVDEEFYSIVDFIYKNKDEFLLKPKQDRIEYIREYFLSQVK